MKSWLIVILLSCSWVGRLWSQSSPTTDPNVPESENAKSLFERSKLGGDWGGAYSNLAQKGLTFELGLTQIYQHNVHGGLSSQHNAGRYSGSYDLEMFADLEKLIGWENTSAYMLTEGSWTNGINARKVGSSLEVNGDVIAPEAIQVSELWVEKSFCEDKLVFRAGKIDLTGGFECRGCPVSFDCNRYANDETSQFLNLAMINNPTIPFPDRGLAFAVHLQPVEGWYASAAISDAQADSRETGFNTTFHDEDYLFSIFETGLIPEFDSAKGKLPGAYRVGFWYDPQPYDDFSTGRGEHDNLGLYFSFDQLICKETEKDDDSQGLGIFGRYGYAPGDRNEIQNFWSTGVQYQGLLPNRDDDVVAIGVAQGVFSDQAGFTESAETAIEWYYNAAIFPWATLTPSVQYIVNPGGDATIPNAVVLGIRLQMAF